MLRFFRNIRKSLMEQSKVRAYLLYAIGEILLVVIGILLALQVNNWNESRIENNQLQNYYSKIIEEIDSSILQINAGIKSSEYILETNKRSLQLISSGHPDSTAELSNTLGALGTAWFTILSFPVIDEFQRTGYLSKVQDDSLKILFQKFSERYKDFESLNEYLDRQYQNTIEPYLINNLNYSEVALPVYKAMVVEGGPQTNYQHLAKDLATWNIITLKLELTTLYLERQIRFKELMNNLILQLDKTAI